LINDAIEFVSPLANKENVAVRTKGVFEAKYVRVDRQRMRQVLINLLSNAVKYNRKDGVVDISVDQFDRVLRIGVADTGSGIAQRDLEKLFVPFERLQAPELGIEGTGLGLSLSRTLLEAMGGSISVTSTLGVGTTFWAELIADEPVVVSLSTKDLDVTLQERSYADVRTVLYVEDVVTNVRLVAEIFKRRPDINLVSSMLGEPAIELALNHMPDLVLLDVHLPDISGAEVLNKLKSTFETREIPVVMVSADASKDQADRFMSEGAIAYLTKPINMRSLLGTVDEILDDQS